jgi:hypothetical protein
VIEMATSKLSVAVAAFMKDEATTKQTALVMDAFFAAENEAIVVACSDAKVKYLDLVSALKSV